jgi:N-ATPase, AtpR subunit
MSATATQIAAFAVFGLALGAAHFSAIDQQSRALMRRAGWMAAALPLLRFAVTGAGLFFAATEGAAALLATAAGISAARLFALRLGRPLA